MLRTFPVVVLVALGLVVACAVDIVAGELSYREERAALDAGELARAARAEAADRELILKCAAGQTSHIFYKGVWCNGR